MIRNYRFVVSILASKQPTQEGIAFYSGNGEWSSQSDSPPSEADTASSFPLVLPADVFSNQASAPSTPERRSHADLQRILDSLIGPAGFVLSGNLPDGESVHSLSDV